MLLKTFEKVNIETKTNYIITRKDTDCEVIESFVVDYTDLDYPNRNLLKRFEYEKKKAVVMFVNFNRAKGMLEVMAKV